MAKQKTTLVNKPKEKDIQKAILEYLNYSGIFCWRNNTGASIGNHNGKSRFFRYGLVGSGDILGLTKGGRFFSIEVKVPGNEPTFAQSLFMEAINNSNGVAFVATSIEDVQKYL